MDKPDGSKVTFSYDADGNRASKSLTSGGPTPTTTTVSDVYQLGHLAYQTDGSGTVLATFSYDDQGVPTSVVLGTDPVNGPRYSYVYNGHGDVVALTDATGTVVASYSYDAFGALTASSESFPNNPSGWTNPYRYDGRDGVRYDGETGLYWLRVRAYDPALGRFLQHDPLGRAPMMWADQPYAYVGNNPLVNVDPNGLMYWPHWGPDGGGGGRGGGGGNNNKPKRPDNRAKAPWYYKNRNPKREAWITSTNPDLPDDHGQHYNLHVALLGGDELANYHIYSLGLQPGGYKWRVIDTFGKGGIRLDQEFPTTPLGAGEANYLPTAAIQAAIDIADTLIKLWGFDQGFKNHLTGLDEDWWDQLREEWGAIENLYDRLKILQNRDPAKF